MKKFIILVIGILTIMSCENSEYGISSDPMDSSQSYESEDSYTSEDGSRENDDVKSKTTDSRKLIWKANLEYQVSNVDESTASIQKIVKQYDGFISSMDLSSTNYQITNTIQIRVSNEKFDELIEELKSEAIFIDELTIKSNDVTEEFVDIQSRLKTKKEVRDRYIDVLRNKAGSVKDIIAAEEAIRIITEEIEAKEGRLRYLKDKVKFGTITVTIYQEVEYKAEPKIYEKPFVKKFIEGLKSGWSIVTAFVLFIANIWPIVIIIGLFIWKRKWILKRIGR